MKILDRYLLAQTVPAFGLTLGVLAFVMVMHRLFLLSDLVVARGVPLGVVFQVLALALPALLPLLIPVSLFVSLLVTMGRMSLDHEVVAMRACGVGLARNLRPVLILSTAMALLTASVSLWIQPAAAAALKRAVYRAVQSRVGAMVQAGVFSEIAPGITAYAEAMGQDGRELRGLFVALDRGPLAGAWIVARSGSIRREGGQLVLDLRNGEIHQHPGPSAPYRRLRFRRYRFRLPVPLPRPSRDVEYTPTPALASLAARGEREARYELHRRLALPAGCWVFGILGACLGLHHSRFGRGRAFPLGLGVLLLYYALLTAGKAVGHRTSLPPEIAVWMPDAVLGALALYAFAVKNREGYLPFEEVLGSIAGRLREWTARRAEG